MQGVSKAVANCESPKCDACEFFKVHPRPNKVNKIKNNTMKEQDPKKDNILPGQMVSSYQYISRASGRPYRTNGKSDLHDVLLLFLLFSWPPVRGLCLNHEVVMFQPSTVTPLYLGSVVNCYVSYSTLINPLRPSPPST